MRVPQNLQFELGPIRPPSEAKSLLLRVLRNCPWNRCTFCPVYKRQSFSARAVEEVLADIEAMGQGAAFLRELSRERGNGKRVTPGLVYGLRREGSLAECSQELALLANWLGAGGKTVFLQDADALLMKPRYLVRILRRLKEVFPQVERITTYARSHTLVRRKTDDLKKLREAGLNRVHVGMESGCDDVLRDIEKGCTQGEQIEGGRRVLEAGMELSEYLMPGLGGRALWRKHAQESAEAVAAIEPHFVRLRSLGLRRHTPLAKRAARGEFEPLDDEEVVREIRLFLEALGEARTTLVSDHFLNLLQELEGRLPEDKERLLSILDEFLSLPERERQLFMVQRRLGLTTYLRDRHDPWARRRAEEVLAEAEESGLSPQELVRQLVARFI